MEENLYELTRVDSSRMIHLTKLELNKILRLKYVKTKSN